MILSVLALIVSFPIAFIIGLFSSDDASGATVIWSYPHPGTASSSRASDLRAGELSTHEIYPYEMVFERSNPLCMAVAVLVAYLGFLALGMPFT